MTLSEELSWRGFVNQTTYKDITAIDGQPINFYWGVDPSADSMTVGNLAAAMMVRHFIEYDHKATLLIGGATGLIGDPDGKTAARELKPAEEIEHNKSKIVDQYHTLFAGQLFELVDNLDWFRNMTYLEFLREVGKHVPLTQMLGREFVKSRLGEDGINYAEFSYSLIQGYDFLHLHREHGIDLQVCGADQWGNSIAGVELIRRVTGDEAHVWSLPLVVNKATGVKFGKSEAGAVWLDPAKTSPTQFYQFWINCDDAGVADYLKIYTLLDKETIDSLVEKHQERPQERLAQTKLAEAVTTLVHGEQATTFAQTVTAYLVGQQAIGEADDEVIAEIRRNIPTAQAAETGSVIEALAKSGLASSNSDARRLLQANAIAVNGQKIRREHFEAADFQQSRLLLRRGKAFKDTALIELG